ncbi:DUF4233 domain-containing protein, partial [Schumannella luteola]
IFILLLVAAAGVQRWRWGIAFGAVLQLALIASGFIEPGMFLVGALFVALWAYCLVRGHQIDTAKAAWLAGQTAATPAPEEGDAP